MKPRKIKLDSGIWRYTVSGRQHRDTWWEHTISVRLWTPAGKQLLVVDSAQTRIARSTCGCGEPYSCSHRSVTPGSLRRYIEQHLAA